MSNRVIVILTFAILVLVAAVPLAVADSHDVVKGGQGPRANATSWQYVPTSNGMWSGHVVNNGLRSLMVDVFDITSGVPDEVMHQRIRFATHDAYPTGVANTDRVFMVLNHTYSITATPSGPKGSSCTVDDSFMPQPPNVVAIITVLSLEDLTVVVDGTMSYDLDGMIVSYDWDFGDGTSATGLTATHTYAKEGTYQITLTVTDNYGLTSTDAEPVMVFWSPHWAAFTYMVEGLTAYVDASASMSENGIVSYTWDWGDGTTGSGVQASHTYSEAGLTTMCSESSRSKPPPPHPIYGFTFGPDGVTPINECFMKFTNVRTRESITYQQETDINAYVIDEQTFYWSGSMNGDIINITATSGTYVGWAEYAINFSNDLDGPWDVVLDAFCEPHTPHLIFGYTFAPDGATPMNNSLLKFTNLRTGEFLSYCDTSTSTNYYSVDLGAFYLFDDPENGEVINITAKRTFYVGGVDAHVGWVEHPVNWSENMEGPWNVTLHHAVEPLTVTITLTVMDSIGQTDSVNQNVTLIAPPVASFTYTVYGSTVIVDAFSSIGYGALNFGWDWGDGTTGTGVVASHTYPSTGLLSTKSECVLPGRARQPGPPHPVFGFTYGPDGVTPMPGCTVTITNLRTGESMLWDENHMNWDPTLNVYSVDMCEYVHGFAYGDMLNVTAAKDSFVGWNVTPITSADYDQIDVILHIMPNPAEIVITLTVTDSVGQTDSVNMTVDLPGMTSPVATFSFITFQMSVTVDGSGSTDTDGTIMSYNWTFGDGGVASGVTASHTYLVPGSYEIMLTVTDDDGFMDSTSEIITVYNKPPVVTFTYTTLGLHVCVNASESSDDYGIASYAWDWGDGTTGSGVTTSHTYVINESISTSSGIVLGAQNGRDQWEPHTIWGYTFAPDGITPLGGCDVTITNLRTAESVAALTFLDSGVYSTDMSQFQLGWEYGDILNISATKGAYEGWAEGTVTDSPGGFDRIDVTLNAGMDRPYMVTVTLTVTDIYGSSRTFSRQIILAVPNSPIVIATSASERLNVTVDGSRSFDPDGTLVSYIWDFGDGCGSTEVFATHSYSVPGTYTITLVVIDNDGLTGTDSMNITASAEIPPVAIAKMTGYLSNWTIKAEGGASYDPDGTIVSYVWDFGDGSVVSGMTVYHTYASAGSYTITLTVTDNEGFTGSATSHFYPNY